MKGRRMRQAAGCEGGGKDHSPQWFLADALGMYWAACLLFPTRDTTS